MLVLQIFVQTPEFQVWSVQLLRATMLAVLKQRPFDRQMPPARQHVDGSEPEHGISPYAGDPSGR